jgi:hypothetical protein
MKSTMPLRSGEVTGGSPRPREERDGPWLVAAAVLFAAVLLLLGL